jgi:site-specific DNA-methyltransferase (adenine-specific)
VKPYYDDGTVTIYHGDCRDVADAIQPGSTDLLLTDPPYGAAWVAKGSTVQSAIAADGARQGMRVVRQALFACLPTLAADAHALVFCHWQSWPDFYDAVSGYLPIKNALIWHKAAGGMGNVRADYIKDYEVILYARLGDRIIGGDGSYSNVLSGFSRPQNRTHPAEKPVALLRQLVMRHAPAGGMVLDPFMGTGSALVAAAECGRRAVGIELDERYCEIAARRCAQDVLDLAAA